MFLALYDSLLEFQIKQAVLFISKINVMCQHVYRYQKESDI